jgi:hypothetical protein
MFVTLPVDLPRGTVINLFHPIANRPVAVLPVPNNVREVTITPLHIHPPTTQQQQQEQEQEQEQVDPNAGPTIPPPPPPLQ